MKNIVLVFLLLLAFTTLNAQQLVVNTTRFVGGNSSCGGGTVCRYAIHTNDGGILFVGNTYCYLGGGDIPPNFPDTATTGFGCGNVIIGKLDSNLSLSWVKVYGGSSCDYGAGAVQTPDGGYAIIATTYSNNRDVSGNHSPGSGDLWLVRVDSMGNLLWQKCYGGPYDDQGFSIALTPDNGFIMIGISNGPGGDVPNHYTTSQFDEDWFVVKVDSVGSKQWAKTIGGTGDEYYTGSILSANGGYYVVSSSSSNDHDCTDTAWHPGVSLGYDDHIIRMDAAGNIEWDSSYGGSGQEYVGQAIWDEQDSSIVINGTTTSPDDYMVTGSYGGGGDMWAIKTDRKGTLKWKKCLGGINEDMGTGIATSTFGYMIYGSTVPGNIGQQDAWIFALDDNGNLQTNKTFGGTNYDTPASIISFKNGFAAIGFTNSQFFTEGINMENLTAPSEDAFISYINYWPLSVQNVNVGDLQMTIYPNPSNGVVRIAFPYQESGNLTIINCIGGRVYTEITNQGELVDITTTSWTSGIYIAQWQGEDGTVLTKRFIKN